MKLRGTEFGHVFCASGARNFFGTEADAYWFHRLPFIKAFYWFMSLVLGRPWGLDYRGSTFVAKTTTFDERTGNMPLMPGTVIPQEQWPRCVVAKPFGGYALNKVGLSGPGAQWLIQQGIWQKRQEPFMISFMSVAATKEERLDELKKFVLMLAMSFRDQTFKSHLALEVNLSCPNVGLDQQKLVDEAREMEQIFYVLGIPVGYKLSVDIEPKVAVEIAKVVDFITCTNTVGFGKLPDKINWKKLFGRDVSPLAQIGPPNSGGGGLSGKPIFPLALEWVREVRRLGLTKPIIGGGGILTPSDAKDMLQAGATAVFIGCVSMLRPWRVADIIYAVNEVCCDQNA